MPDEVKPDTALKEQALSEGGGVVNDVAVDSQDEALRDVKSPSEPIDGIDGGGEGGGPSPDIRDDAVAEAEAEAVMQAMLEKEEQEEPGVESRQDLSDEFPDLSHIKMEKTMANPAEFQQLSPSQTPMSASRNIDLLLDVKMPLAIELGRTEMPISEILTLGPGSVVELDKLAGEPVDLLVNDKIIAKGEVVVVDENFGVRITMLMSPEERLKSLAKQ